MSRILKISLLAALCAFLSVDALAAPAPKVTSIDPPKNILFIGNSFTYYNNGLHNYLKRFIDTADPSGESSQAIRLMTISGAKLSEHAPALRSILQSADWDAVILQGHSLEAVDKRALKNFRAAARAFDKEIRKSGADTVYFMTWAYTDRPEMTASLNTSYTIIGNHVKALVVPVGLAFERAQQLHPEIPLIMADKKHPTLAGTYLTASVFYAALFNKSPAPLDYSPPRLDKNKASLLREVAWQSVRAYYDPPSSSDD